MKIKNTTSWPDHFLRAMTLWICDEIDLPKRQVKIAQFKNTSRQWSGYAWFARGEIMTRVRKTNFIIPDIHTRFGRTHIWIDRLEILVAITTHELTHIRQYNDLGRNSRERECDRVMAEVLDIFRANRGTLLLQWNAAKRPSKAKPTLSAPERREANARKLLAEWKTKKSRATNAIRKYRAKIKYYERKHAQAAKKKGG